MKYTDKWAERDVGYGALDKWGDKWEENFKDGTGYKKGETWSSDGRSGHSFNRWWGEDHLGGGRVRKHGHSTEGESWDNGEKRERERVGGGEGGGVRERVSREVLGSSFFFFFFLFKKKKLTFQKKKNFQKLSKQSRRWTPTTTPSLTLPTRWRWRTRRS